MNLIFVTYIARSGSTFLLNEFSKFKEILVCPEAEILIFMLLKKNNKFVYNNYVKRQLTNYLENNRKLNNWGLKIEDLFNLNNVDTNFEAFIEILKAYRKKIKPDASTIVYKAEIFIDYYNIPSRFKTKYSLKYISLIRDPRSVFSSHKNTISGFTGRIMDNNPFRIARKWNKFVAKSQRLQNNDDFFIIKYEELLKNYPESIYDILNKTGVNTLTFSSEHGDLFDRIPKAQHSMHLNILKEPDKTRIKIWERNISSNEVFILEYISGKKMLEKDYKLSSPKINKLNSFFYLIRHILNYLYTLIIYKLKRYLKIFYFLFKYKIMISQ